MGCVIVGRLLAFPNSLLSLLARSLLVGPYPQSFRLLYRSPPSSCTIFVVGVAEVGTRASEHAVCFLCSR